MTSTRTQIEAPATDVRDLCKSYGEVHLSSLGGISYNDFFVPGILAYGVIGTTFCGGPWASRHSVRLHE